MSVINVEKMGTIDLGRQGENLARTIKIDVSSILTKWPDASFFLLVKRKGDADPYHAVITVEEGILSWPITKVDTAVAGDGKIEIRAVSGEVIAKSAVATMRVTASLAGTDSTEIPDEQQGWLDDFEQKAEKAITSIREAKQEVDDAVLQAEQIFENIPPEYAALSEAVSQKAPAIFVDASGEMVHITDGAEGMPVKSLITHVEPVQSGSGDPSPVNVRPFVGLDNVSLAGTGKNLLPGGTLAFTAKKTISFSPPLPPGTYTLTAMVESEDTDNTLNSAYFNSDTAGRFQFHRGVRESVTLTYNKPIKNMLFCAGLTGAASTGDACTWTDVLLTSGDASTEFEPYEGKTLTAELPETLYGFDKNWTTGLVTVRRVKRKIKDFNWDAYTGVAGGYRYEALVTNKAEGEKGLLCDTLPVVSYYVENKAETISERSNKYATIRIITAYATKAEMLAAYGEAEVVYYLAEPYTIQLTPQQMETLKGTNNIWSNAGETAVTYAADTKMYIDQKIAAIAAAIV